MTNFVLITAHYVQTINSFIYILIFGVYFGLFVIHLHSTDASLFIYVVNVYLIHSLLMNLLMCSSFWKYVGIELNQTLFPKS